MVDKAKNRKIIQLHYQHKREKLRQRLHSERERSEKLAKEMEENEKEDEENLIFRLAEESFPASETNDNDSTEVQTHAVSREAAATTKKFDYTANELKLISQEEALCGRKVGNRVILRGYRDHLHTEPRGKSNLHLVHDSANDSDCLTHKDWLRNVANDPKVLVRMLSS